MQVEDRIVSAHKKLCESVKKCRKTHFIWDTNIFYSFVKEIKYFAVLKLITDDDVLHLKTELYQLLAMMEELSVTGEFSEGGKVCFYLSNIHFEATYSYIENGISNKFIAGVFHQFNGFTKFLYLPDAM